MVNKIINKLNFVVLAALAVTSFCLKESIVVGQTAVPKSSHLSHYFHDFPWIGLIANEINYGPIRISKVNLNNAGKVVVVNPKEKIHGTVNYKINAKQLHSMHLYHIVVGIKKVGAQDCITHTLGVWNSKGKGKFTLKAPAQKGVYEVRFNYFEGATCQSARDAWDTSIGQPSSAATIAVVIVE